MVGVGALIFDRDRILMAQRGKEPLKGWWSLPGGALELGESLADGVRREVREETGLEIRPLGVLEIFERIMRDAERRARISLRADRLHLPHHRRGRCAPATTSARWNGCAAGDLPKLQITEGTLARD